MAVMQNDSDQVAAIAEKIRAGKTSLGIEFGSTRIKAVLIDDTYRTIASGDYNWASHLENGLWSYTLEEITSWLERYGEPLRPFIRETGRFLMGAAAAGKRILFEAQLGALRDLDFGIYPYTSSSSTIAAYAPIGAGVPGLKLDLTVGIMKAYSSCVGEGPFTVEMSGDEAVALREAGGEYGAATGRPRRVGAFDAVASRYGVRVQGADQLALTKLDTISYMEKIPVCVAYDIDGKIVEDFPTGEALNIAKPIFEYVDGWKCDISACRKKEDLPEKALEYVKYLEKLVGASIKYVSVGPEREAYIEF